MTPRLDAIRERHDLGRNIAGWNFCRCGQTMPCDAGVALAEVERLRGASELALSALRRRERAAGRMRPSAEVLFLTATLDGMRLAPELQVEIDALAAKLREAKS